MKTGVPNTFDMWNLGISFVMRTLVSALLVFLFTAPPDPAEGLILKSFCTCCYSGRVEQQTLAKPLCGYVVMWLCGFCYHHLVSQQALRASPVLCHLRCHLYLSQELSELLCV